jgi:hypothetical protein
MLALLLMMAFAQDPTPVPNPDVPSDPESWERVGFGWGGVPAVNFNSDEGFGFGAVANLYRYNGTSAPYSYNLGAQFFMTSKGIHNHRVEIDALRVGGTPLRLTARVQLAVTRAANFCGFGFDVTCDPAVAEQAADDLALTGDDRDTFTGRYYKTRFVRPYAFINARYAINPMPHRVEFFGGVRVEWHQPGDFTSTDPFPDSLYATAFPDGERGFLSVLQAGVMVDNRDNEPAPRRGYWIEGSLRGAAPYWGSNWSYFGVNTTLRGYLPLTKDERVVGATRVVLDGFVGDAPVREWANPGGSALYELYGSLNAGRGIRARRYLGRARTVLQQEVRWTFVKAKIGSVPVNLTVLGFADVGVVAQDWSDLGDAFAEPLVGTGGGLRIAIDSNFIIRADMGLSAKEDWSPSLYIDLANLF